MSAVPLGSRAAVPIADTSKTRWWDLLGIDWAGKHHDVEVVDESGALLDKRRIADDLTGFAELLWMLA